MPYPYLHCHFVPNGSSLSLVHVLSVLALQTHSTVKSLNVRNRGNKSSSIPSGQLGEGTEMSHNGIAQFVHVALSHLLATC